MSMRNSGFVVVPYLDYACRLQLPRLLRYSVTPGTTTLDTGRGITHGSLRSSLQISVVSCHHGTTCTVATHLKKFVHPHGHYDKMDVK